MSKKYESVKDFWGYQGAAGRLQYLSKEWHILKNFNINIIYQDWEDLEEEEKKAIYKRHKKAVGSTY